ncbi:virulence protein RhuM/Fic/DOC family protein [Spiribacter vilamensis]|uniref:Fic/DOC family protein n=1 Tax=Spiribacter vilamensis TaxID=531306 RepID=A0A4V2GJ70_9GAMM|nr:virulence protein RhuM/Fic/DOC family protein [Spiribacter vilamensis]RZU98735.1 Fic/DOC family protein [Spiribacter vilamensis]TVO62242.1 Fic/DOC family protein [Spiribacter vilamensis]
MEQGTQTTEIAIFEAETGEVRVQILEESVWLTQRQMAEVFETSTDNISLHLRNIFADGEMAEEATTEDFSVLRREGQREVRRRLRHYGLDVILAVGYRVSSGRAIQFRKWATRILRDHLVQGYTLNRQRFEENARELEAALQLVRKAAAAPALDARSGQGLVEILSHYTRTFLWLQRYDEGCLQEPGGQPGGDLPTPDEAMAALNDLKAELMAREEATELFARLRDDGLASILGNLDQTVFGQPAYPSIEAKAAHLLYFVVKNHPFSDGNKRSGAFLFVDFLHRNRRLLDETQRPVVNDAGLAALTLLVAESAADQKETLIHLIMNMLAQDNS